MGPASSMRARDGGRGTIHANGGEEQIHHCIHLIGHTDDRWLDIIKRGCVCVCVCISGAAAAARARQEGVSERSGAWWSCWLVAAAGGVQGSCGGRVRGRGGGGGV